jgi:Fe(3+) dicitrate transport protein
MRWAVAGCPTGTTISLTAYRIDFNNQIQLDNTSRNYVNLGATRNQGIELSGQWSPAFLPRLTLNAAWTYLDAEQRTAPMQGCACPMPLAISQRRVAL